MNIKPEEVQRIINVIRNVRNEWRTDPEYQRQIDIEVKALEIFHKILVELGE